MPNEEIQLESIPHGKLGLITLASSAPLGHKVDQYLVKWRSTRQQLHPNETVKQKAQSKNLCGVMICILC